MTEAPTPRKYTIVQPVQTKLGGWIAAVKTEDQLVTLHETFQPTKTMAFNDCVQWCMEYDFYHPLGWRPDAENPVIEAPPENPHNIQSEPKDV
jgi:hypothetical protein